MPDPAASPLHVQISALLMREIASGRLVEGERLPPEREMAREHGVSVGTLRRALADLAAQGLLERLQGSGNYVRRARDVGGLYGFFRLERVEGGGWPTAELIDLEQRAKPAGAPDFGPSPKAWRIRRLRRLGGEAAALEEIWLDADWAAELEPKDLAESLYQTYRQRLGLRIERVEDRVGVDHVPDWPGARLTVPSGSPCGLVERVSWAHTGARAEFSRSWFDPVRTRYVCRIR